MILQVFLNDMRRNLIQDLSKSAMTGKSVALLAVLVVAGFIGNFFTIPLFFGADFLFGSIAVLLVLYFYGLGWGVFAAIIVHSYTYFLWAHPYGFLNFTCEVLFIGLFLRRGHGNLLVLDALFWLTIGIPLVWVEHGIVMHMGTISTVFIMFKQAINGIFNALLVSLTICYLPLGKFFRRSQPLPKITLQESLFDLLVMMVLFPALLLTMLQSRYETNRMETLVMAELQSLSTNVQSHVRSWYQLHLQAVQELAVLAGQFSMTPSTGLQHDTETLKRAFPDFVTMHVENAEGRSIAFDPKVNDKGEPTLGLDFSWRGWFQDVKAKQRTFVSEVFMGQLVVFSPIITLSVPVIRESRWLGCSTGTLDLKRMQEMLRHYGSDKAILTLTDSQGRIVASTAPGRRPMQSWDWRKTGLVQPLDTLMYLWQPDDKKLPSMTRWKGSFYVKEVLMGPELPWKLTAEIPLAPLQSILYVIYVKNLAIMACLIALALILSLMVSRRITRPLAELAEVTANLPQKLSGDENLGWPSSSAREVDSLISNSKSMAKALKVNFRRLQLQSDELTQTNRELAQEVWDRQQAEKALRKSEEQAKQLAQENSIIAEIGRIISSTLNIEEVYDRFAEEARKIIPFDRIVINIINIEENTVTNVYIAGKAITDRKTGETYPLTGSGNAEMVRTESSLLLQAEDFDRCKDRYPMLSSTFQAGFRSLMNVPLFSKGKIIGGLLLRSLKAYAYTDRDVRLAERVGNQIAGAVANARLFTERQGLEERLRRAEKMEALGTLAGGVAHDLNNVLGVLVGYSELLLLEIPEGKPLRKHVSNIFQSGQRAAAIIQDLLTLARRGVAVPQIVNLNDLISDYLKTPEFEKLKAYHPRVTFNIDLDKDLLNIKGSPIHLNKTIMNLLSNAAEAIIGDGNVTVRTENLYLDKPVAGYDAIREGDYVVLSVSDDGRGISKEDIRKIFEPFYTKKVMGRSGTGLGLAVVWGTVKDHGGYIDVESEEGKGSVFTLYFQVTREEMTKGQALPISSDSYRARGESILVIDDVKEQRDLAVAMLSRLGYRVDAVSSGEEAVSYLKTRPVDLLVLDMIMDPGIDGLETYMRVVEIHPKQKAIIVSGFSETDRVKAAQELGAGVYIRKPYVSERLGIAIRRELDR